MPIKDLIKRREYQKNLMAKKRTLNNEGLTSNNVSPQISSGKNKLDPVRPCSRCQEIESSITNFYNLVIEEQNLSKELTKQIRELEKQLTNANLILKNELKIKALYLKEINQLKNQSISN